MNDCHKEGARKSPQCTGDWILNMHWEGQVLVTNEGFLLPQASTFSESTSPKYAHLCLHLFPLRFCCSNIAPKGGCLFSAREIWVNWAGSKGVEAAQLLTSMETGLQSDHSSPACGERTLGS